ncbi:prepilin peptidase [Candidatus Microgenomates bacterium]|nr:prepilin peptidase [Candidatus Microgenomates bacterium]
MSFGESYTYLFIFVLGASVGSFLNVLIDRLPREEQIFKGRSHCDHCQHKLSALDLFPIVSWVILRGRCRYCHSPIRWQNPVVELSTGILFVSTFYFFPAGNTYNLLPNIYYLILISALIAIFVIDLKHQIIPDKIVYPAILVSLLFLIINSKFLILNFLLAALGAALFFALVIVITAGRGMGWGDVKLVGLMGLFLGFPKIIVALYLAFLTGSILGVILILLGKKRFGQNIPFGPFLAGASIFSIFFGEKAWQFLVKTLGLV